MAELFEASTDGTVRASCVKAYAQIASNYPDQTFSPAAMAVLEKALSDDSPVVSQSAVMALGQVGVQALPLLIQICKGDNIAHVQSAAMALAEIPDPSAEACLREVLADPSTDPLCRQMVELISCLKAGILESRVIIIWLFLKNTGQRPLSLRPVVAHAVLDANTTDVTLRERRKIASLFKSSDVS